MKELMFCVILMVTVAFDCSGWGPTGHRATGWIADRYLSKKARSAVEKILNGETLAMASTWMDEIRSDSTYDYMADWHWVTIPPRQTYASTVKNPRGDIIQTLEKIISALKTKKVSPKQEAEYLKILIHLTGDIHQPLHVGARDDRGGNNIRVMWFNNNSNLHRVWDSDMIDDSRLSYTELAQSLGTPSGEQVRIWQKASIQDWARESQSYEQEVYNYGNGKLGYRYAYVNFPIVRKRLLQAGVRLAGILNDLYK